MGLESSYSYVTKIVFQEGLLSFRNTCCKVGVEGHLLWTIQ